VRFTEDQSGNYTIIAALALPVLVGFGSLGTEYGTWVYTHQNMQGAASSAAVSATVAANPTTEAKAIAASYGFTDGVNNVSVTLDQPPAAGPYVSNTSASEVVIQQSQPRMLSALFGSDPVTISARAVALAKPSNGCVLALDRSASGALTEQGSTQVTLTGCSVYDNSANAAAMSTGGTFTADSVNVVGGISGSTSGITTTNGIRTGVAAASDPYSNVAIPSFSGCDQNNFSAHSSMTINPGVYCNGISLNAGAVVTMNPGIYIIDQGSLFVRGGATLKGTGVTIIFTSSTHSNYATATINGNATINLTASNTGPTAGLVFFGDRNMPTGTNFKLNGGSAQSFGGAIYLPQAALSYSGNSAASNGCTQIIADTVTFTGNSNVALNCSGYGTQAIGYPTATLVE
jgi:Flp pilus assembly protein TadG